MSFDENDYSSSHLLGNVDLPRNLLPTLRSTYRRNDPDGGSAVPYFANASGKTLRVTYTIEVLSVVTDTQADIALASNSLASIISTINAVDASNLEALDQDGFLVLRNKNPGKTHRIEIEPWTVPANDAAPVFGFRVSPFPGSVSYAGELSSSPGNRDEENPQGTALLAKDEGITPATLNRPYVALLQLIQEIQSELERDVIVYREVEATLVIHPISNSWPSYALADDTLRLPIEMMGMAGETIGGDVGKLDPFFTVLSPDGLNSEFGKDPVPDSYTGDLNPGGVLGAFYATAGTAYNDTVSFTAWGTPDGGSIYGPTVPNKNKHAAVAISSFDGNIAYCPGATFETLLVKKNDPVQISNAVSTTPFDHSGWFAVERVIDEEHIALRPLSAAERVPAAGNRPRALNPEGLGDLRVAVGYFIPAQDVWLYVDVNGVQDVRLRVATAVPFREALAEDFALGRTGTWQYIATLLNDHISGSPERHIATQISGFTSATTWADGAAITGADLKATIEDILTDLADATAPDGAGRIGSDSLSIGGATPNTIAAGTVRSQLIALLTTLRDQVNYDGSGNWADSTNIPAQNIEGALDQIVSDLASATPGDDGAMKIGSESRSSGEVVSGSIASQLEFIAANWGRLARAQNWTALNNFLSAITVDGGSGGDSNANPAVYSLGPAGGGSAKLLWRIEAGSGAFVRIYSYVGALVDSGVSALAVTINAAYGTSGNNWTADTAGQQAIIMVLTRNALHLANKAATGSPWLDSAWDSAYSFTGGGDLFVENIDIGTLLTADTANISGTTVDTNGAVTVAANQSVTVSGTGSYKHGELKLSLPAFSGLPIYTGAIQGWDPFQSIAGAACYWATPGNGEDVVFAIPLKVGDRIKRVDVFVQDTTGGHTISIYLHRSDATDDLITGSVLIAGPTTSAGDGSRQTLSLTGLTATIATSQFYHVIVRQNSATSTTSRVVGVEVTYDRV